MRKVVEIPGYVPTQGVRTEWEDGFIISFIPGSNGSMVLSANTAGLVSLARHLLTLAQSEVPAGSHIHYDKDRTLEPGSEELIIVKIPD